MFTPGHPKRMHLEMKPFHFRSIEPFAMLVLRAEPGGGPWSMHASKSRSRRHLHKPCGQGKWDDSLPAHSTSCNDAEWEAERPTCVMH